MRGRLPLTWEAFAAGRIDERRVRLIASAVDKLAENHLTIELDYWVVEYAATHTTAQLRAWLRRFVARNAPNSRTARIEREKRSVWLSHQDDALRSSPPTSQHRTPSGSTPSSPGWPRPSPRRPHPRPEARRRVRARHARRRLVGPRHDRGAGARDISRRPRRRARRLVRRAVRPPGNDGARTRRRTGHVLLPRVHRSARPHPRRHRARPVPVSQAQNSYRHPRRHLPVRHLLASGHRVRRRSSDPASAGPHEWREHPLARRDITG